MMRVLVVDDSRTMRRMLRRGLHMAGIEDQQIIEAEDGVVAMEQIAEFEPALMLCDVNMPRMDGIELLRGLQDVAGKPLAVMVTSVASTSARLEMVRLGARSIVSKPFDPLELPQLLAPHLTSARESLEATVEPEAFEPVQEISEADPEQAEQVYEVAEAEMRDSLRSVLEKMAFVEARRVDATPPGSRIGHLATTRFVGPQGFAVSLACEGTTADELALALLGGEVGEDDEARLDSVAELCNVVIGDLGRRLEVALGEGRDWSFGLPERAVALPHRWGHDFDAWDLGGGQVLFSKLITGCEEIEP